MISLREYSLLVVEDKQSKNTRVNLERIETELYNGNPRRAINIVVLIRNMLYNGVAPTESLLTFEEREEVDGLIRRAEELYMKIPTAFFNYVSINKNRQKELLEWGTGSLTDKLTGIVNHVTNKLNQEIIKARRSLPSLDARNKPRQRKRPRYVRAKFIEKREVLSFYSNNKNNIANLFELSDTIKNTMKILRTKGVDGSITVDPDFNTNPIEYIMTMDKHNKVKLQKKSDIS